MLSDMELFGIPHRLVLGERGLDAGTIEYQGLRDSGNQKPPLLPILAFIQSQLTAGGA